MSVNMGPIHKEKRSHYEFDCLKYGKTMPWVMSLDI